MEPRHARYPFLAESRSAVEEAGVDLARVVADEPVVVERALERVERALTSGDVGEPHRRPRVELLSYPIARVLVSIADVHVLTRRYARGEARTAYERFRADLSAADDLKSTRDTRLTLADLLAEFDLAGDVRETLDGYRVEVGTYLAYGAGQWGDEWRLVNRELADGEVGLSAEELLELLEQAVQARIEEGLPLSVPDAIAAELETERERVEGLVADLELTRDIDTVVPDLFPPCMKYLLDQVQKGAHLAHHSRFAIASFLTSIGMSTDEIVDIFEVNPGFGEEATRYQVDHIRGDTSPTSYSPPACATMQSYGDCVNKDDVCETVIRETHPLSYYEYQLEEADEEELIDWREQAEGEETPS